MIIQLSYSDSNKIFIYNKNFNMARDSQWVCDGRKSYYYSCMDFKVLFDASMQVVCNIQV